MDQNSAYFFCGIGGSGMMPLALLLRAQGHGVSGSDRALDQGRTPEKFAFLRGQDIALFPQDGTGVTRPEITVVASAAVESNVPDIRAATKLGARIIMRAELLAELFNAASTSIGIAGTSGKTTTTGMIGFILNEVGQRPTIVNGGVMRNFVSTATPFASAVIGRSDLFVCEVDESDGSIERYKPSIAVLNNVALDHKSLEELRILFRQFVLRARVSVLNLDNAECQKIGCDIVKDAITFGIDSEQARLTAYEMRLSARGAIFRLRDRETGSMTEVSLQVPGRHNVSNALAAIGAATAIGVPIDSSAQILARFSGIRRRLEWVGTADGITVIDDFAHNPDKIAATLATLHAVPGRLLVMFQPHGFGPLKKMRDAFIDVFSQALDADDVLVMPEPVYFGGTADRSVGSGDIVRCIAGSGRNAHAFATRTLCGDWLVKNAHPGDRVIIMGARDDSLSDFAQELLGRLRPRETSSG